MCGEREREQRPQSRERERDNRYGKRDREKGYDRNDRNGRDADRNAPKKRFNQEQRGAISRLFINLGKEQKISKSDILGAIAGETGLSGNKIGTIDIYEQHSFVDVPAGEAQHVIRTMNKSTIKGKKVNLSLID